jgi:hypothetical protein
VKNLVVIANWQSATNDVEAMRIRNRSQYLATALVFLLLLAPVFGGVGQSGRTPPPQTTAVPAKTESAFVPDPNRDEYQLVFTKGYEALKKGQKVNLEEQWEHYTTGFIAELNRIGAQGYRVISIALSPLAAVLKRSDQQYEYQMLQVINQKRVFDGNAQFGPRYAPWARKGFRVADYFVLYDWCWPGKWDENGNWEPVDCTYHSQALLERQKNAEAPRNYDIVSARLTFSKEKLETGLTEELHDARKTNLYPTHLLTKFQLLTQSPLGTEDFLGDEYEMEIVSGDVKKRVNELAQQGYRLSLRPLGLQAAVMYRKKGTTTPASYIWVNEKRLEQELPGLQQQGAAYRMSDGCAAGSLFQPQMIFEQPSERGGKQREYKTLAFELNEPQNEAAQRVEFELSPASIKAIAEFNRLTKDGFEVQDFFACDMSDKKTRRSRVKLLLERAK